MQHTPQISWLFVGTHTLAELNPTVWNSFFNVALHRRLGSALGR
jgi:hypothetical protein